MRNEDNNYYERIEGDGRVRVPLEYREEPWRGGLLLGAIIVLSVPIVLVFAGYGCYRAVAG